MLVLSRKVGEKLVIGGNITVVVSKVAGNRVTLGIEAPSDVRVIRGELQFEVELPEAAAEVVASEADDHATVPFDPAAVRSAERTPVRGNTPLAGRVARTRSDATPRLAK